MLTVRIAASLYLLGGLSQLVLWPVLLATGQVAEVQRAPVFLAFHLAAEAAGALLGIATGAGLWLGRGWARRAYFFTTGVLLVAGYLAALFYAFAREPNWQVMLALLVAGTLAQAVLLRLLFRRLVPGRQHAEAKVTLLFTGALSYTLLNAAGFFAQEGGAVAPGYASIILLLFGLGIWRYKNASYTI